MVKKKKKAKKENESEIGILEKKVTQQFLLRFAIIFGFTQLLLATPPLRILQEWIAQITANTLGFWSMGNLVIIPKGVFEITPSCTGITSMGMFAGLLLGFSEFSLKQKIKPLLAGIIILFLVNLIRVILIVQIGYWTDIATAEKAHIISWFGMSILSAWLWYYWISRKMKTKNIIQLSQKLMEEK